MLSAAGARELVRKGHPRVEGLKRPKTVTVATFAGGFHRKGEKIDACLILGVVNLEIHSVVLSTF
jgi:hypothetical protein